MSAGDKENCQLFTQWPVTEDLWCVSETSSTCEAADNRNVHWLNKQLNRTGGRGGWGVVGGREGEDKTLALNEKSKETRRNIGFQFYPILWGHWSCRFRFAEQRETTGSCWRFRCTTLV